ncbi:DoxX family protein [Microbacterium gorillae]|uniref:DoxX family protein n=1 Tax=Microbacterium gorillae TaxID=1231063 RepID=UPI00058EB56F|nr:DoxX family protein [Microbacterium gorillae]
MNTVLWIVQSLLAVVFLASGVVKSIAGKERLIATGQTGVAPYPIGFIRVIAACEIVGALGLIVPLATGIAPLLTPLAAVGLAIIMIGAAFSHLSLGEWKQALTVNLILFLLCLFVALGRILGW